MRRSPALPAPFAAYMDQHLTSQSSTVFRSCHSLIYIFDVESEQLLNSDVHYFIKCLAALKAQNPETGADGAGGPTVYVLLHKMDLISDAEQKTRFSEFETNVRKRTAELGWKGGLAFFGTSIWNETLYKVSTQLSQRSGERQASYRQLAAKGVLHLYRPLDGSGVMEQAGDRS